MSVQYHAIGWNRQKRIYDGIVAGSVLVYLGLFVGVGSLVHPNATAETLLIRGFGTGAFLLLNVILSIGPLCRLNRRFHPLLYNRRHLGVTMFLLALVHGAFSIVQFHALGDVNPLVSVFVSNKQYGSVAQFPFQSLGFFALGILFLMAATSHDFWLSNLSPGVWKRLHMFVYAAYGLLVAHVTLGALQSERNVWLAVTMAAGLAAVATLHLLSGRKESRVDESVPAQASDGFVDVCPVNAIPEDRAAIVCAAGERVAVFRYGGKLSAVSNVCRHQNGPLGEGKIIDGCITCPWHGYQYKPETGAAPPPFTEKVPTYALRVRNGRVQINPRPNPPGTFVEPARLETFAVREENAQLRTR
jgi:nitrite reductase/ring-hydroxylating ferredoxin subunit/DMSO/TMAO reductase YedYZ heme-binding membrane subunit